MLIAFFIHHVARTHSSGVIAWLAWRGCPARRDVRRVGISTILPLSMPKISLLKSVVPIRRKPRRMGQPFCVIPTSALSSCGDGFLINVGLDRFEHDRGCPTRRDVRRVGISAADNQSIYSHEARPFAVRSPGLGRSPRWNSAESCSTPTLEVRERVRASPGCDACIVASQSASFRGRQRSRRSAVARGDRVSTMHTRGRSDLGYCVTEESAKYDARSFV